MSIVLLGSTSGSCTLQEQAVAGTTTLTLPTITGTVGVLVSGTAVATTSGTSIDFTSIPAGVRRITVMWSGVTASSTSSFLIQLGTSSGVVTSGYNSSGTGFLAPTTLATASSTAGFITRNARTASSVYSGAAYITNLSGTAWVVNGGFAAAAATENAFFSGGIASLGGTLDRIRFTTVSGTDTFSAGSINILYE